MNNLRPYPHATATATAGALEDAVLRTAGEPCVSIDDATVHRLLTASPGAYFDHMLGRLRTSPRAASLWRCRRNRFSRIPATPPISA